MATSKKQLEIAQTKLKEIKKKYPVGIYDSNESYTVKVIGHKIGDFGGEVCLLTELYYTNNPHYGKSVWEAILMIKNKPVTKHFLDKGKYKLRK